MTGALSCGQANALTMNTKDPLVLLQDWAVVTTKDWSKEVQREMRRQKRIQTSLRFRARKKQELAELRHERDQLEAEVKRRFAAMEIVAYAGRTAEDEMSDALCRLAVECDNFRAENLQLQQNLRQYERFMALLGGNLDAVVPTRIIDCGSLTVRGASKTSQCVSCALRDEPAWRVYFPRHEPSFYFYPFSRPEFESCLEVCDRMLAVSLPCSSIRGPLLSWTVRHAPLIHRDDNSCFAHARFTTRVSCGLDGADAFMTSVPVNAASVLIIPPDGSRAPRDLINIQVLQEFDQDRFVMVCNIPGQVHTRYFQVARRLPLINENGRRSITYSMVVADTEANRQNRAIEAPQPDVQWANEAGVCMKFTEVNDTTIDVSSDYWSGCEDPEHAKHYFVLWGEYVCQWLQFVAPPNLLES